MLLSMVLITIALTVLSQTPQAFKYQAVVRDNSGEILQNQAVGIRISIHDSIAGGTVVYQETFIETTNDFGLVNMEIGNGTPTIGAFTDIDWGSNSKFLETEIGPTGGNSYVSMGTSQMLSVPFALLSQNADITNTISDTDGDTYITPEQNPDDDTIRMYIEGVEKIRITSKSIELLNNGRSIFIGEGAGANDDLSDNNNVAIGTGAMFYNTSKFENIAIGDSVLKYNGQGSVWLWEGTGNTAVGSKSMLSNKIGWYNTALGCHALNQNSNGAHNTAIGYQAMLSNISGIENTSIGEAALGLNTTGNDNVAIGTFTMYGNISGHKNTAVGKLALRYNTTGNSNIAIGYRALFNNKDGSNLIAIGDSALYNNGTDTIWINEPKNNIAVGSKALYANTTGYNNAAYGNYALYSNTTGYKNTAIGYRTLDDNSSGDYNTACGSATLNSNTEGSNNTAFGSAALSHNTTGDRNTAVGLAALNGNTSGFGNTSTGYGALMASQVGDYCTAIGYLSFGWNELDNASALGANAQPITDGDIRLGDNAVDWIGGHSEWYKTSDGRFKTNIKENVPGLDFILELRPVSYQWDVQKLNNYMAIPDSAYKGNVLEDLVLKKEAIVYTGFVAQEVEQAARKTGYDFSGIHVPENEHDPYSLAYSSFIMPLVKAVQELAEQNQALQAEIKELKEKIK